MKSNHCVNKQIDQYQYQYQYNYQHQQSVYDKISDNNAFEQEQQTIKIVKDKAVNEQQQQYSGDNSISNNTVQRLKQQLIFVYQGRVLGKVFGELQQKLYWRKFTTFQIIKYKTSLHNRTTKLITSINSIVVKYTTQRQLKSIFFTKIKSIEHNHYHQKNLKTTFFIKYFINPMYVDLSVAFNKVKRLLEGRNEFVGGEKNARNDNLKAVSDERLVKFQKQSRKYRVKQITVTLRNFITRKYLKPTFAMINLSAYSNQIQPNSQSIPQKQPQYSARPQLSTNQKDARFIKKRVIPHKILHQQDQQLSKRPYLQSSVLTLQKLSIGNYEIQTIKRKHFQELRFIITTLENIITSRYSSAWLRIRQKMSNNNYNNRITGQIALKDQKQVRLLTRDIVADEQDNSQSQIIISVLRTMCYVSSRASKRKQKKLLVERQKSSLLKLTTTLQNKLKQNLISTFYSMKWQLMQQNIMIIHRIQELQEIKRQCLEYFNNSIMDEESYQIVDDHGEQQ